MNRGERRKLAKLSSKKASSMIYNKQQLIELASNKLVNDDLVQALKIYKQILELSPDDPSVLHFAGITCYKLGNYTEAVQLFNEAIHYAPNYAEVYNSKGIVLLQQKQYQESRECFEYSIKLKPSYDNAYLNLGDALIGLNLLEDAIENYEKALAFNNDNIEAAYKLAGCCLSKDDYKSAIQYCDYSLQLNPHCQNGLAYKAIASIANKNIEQWKYLYDFDEMIKQFHIQTPNTFSSIEDFNAALEKDILSHNSLIWEPLDRVTNGGAVTSDLLLHPTRSLKLLEKSIKKIINNFIEIMPSCNDHPFYQLKPKKYKITLIGSILKQKGIHPPHIHENSWLSGVYYVNTPKAVFKDDLDHHGWLEFGRPDIDLCNENILKVTARYPEPGTLLIFPSYFFHGTIPFDSDEKRIGIAFDLYPIN